MATERLYLSIVFAAGLSVTVPHVDARSCTFERAHYAYTADSSVTASFVKLPPTSNLVGDLGMYLDVNGKHLYAFGFDSGSRFTATIMPVPSTGPAAWTVEEGKPDESGFPAMDFHQWTGDTLFDGVPRSGAKAPQVLFIPALDEALRHNPGASVKPEPGFFKLARCG